MDELYEPHKGDAMVFALGATMQGGALGRRTVSSGLAGRGSPGAAALSASRLGVVASIRGSALKLRAWGAKAARPALRRPATTRALEEANSEEGFRKDWDTDDPHKILRISPGTSYGGLIVARRDARAAAEGDPDKLAKVEEAFEKFVGGAKRRFIQAMEDDPKNPDATYSLANLYQTLEDYDNAEEYYWKTLELDNTHINAINNLAMLLAEVKGMVVEADQLFAKGAEVSPEDVDILFNWAMLKLNVHKDLKGTRVLVERIVAIKPELKDHDLIKELSAQI
mmetsp:Transcript_24338/g.76790  ORF Transcript_24338/g.76790 Transcript_24338/m.76790 type:complete len:282 (-) Transcript_24338:1542-2387(-)